MADLEALLKELHGATVEALLKRVQSGEATASDLNVARQMLKDHGINSMPAKSSPLANLAHALPDLDDDETVVQFGRR